MGETPDRIIVKWNPPLTILPRDAGKAGTSWVITMNVVREKPEHREMAVEYPYVVASTGETVTVPAGTFSDCIRVRGIETSDNGDILRVSDTYYAPDVGNVLFIQSKPEDTAFRSELVAYSIVDE